MQMLAKAALHDLNAKFCSIKSTFRYRSICFHFLSSVSILSTATIWWVMAKHLISIFDYNYFSFCVEDKNHRFVSICTGRWRIRGISSGDDSHSPLFTSLKSAPQKEANLSNPWRLTSFTICMSNVNMVSWMDRITLPTEISFLRTIDERNLHSP